MDYVRAMKFQQIIHSERVNNFREDTIIILEHPNTITLGRRSDQSHIITPKRNLEDSGFSIVTTDRGGQATFHGPGQLVGYPILDLNQYKKSISWYMRELEQLIIDVLKEYNIHSYADKKNIGIWVGNKDKSMKIAAIGIRIKKWIAYHGFSLNISNDLTKYKGIIPCGIKNKGITSLKSLGIKDFRNIEKIIIKKFLDIFV